MYQQRSLWKKNNNNGSIGISFGSSSSSGNGNGNGSSGGSNGRHMRSSSSFFEEMRKLRTALVMVREERNEELFFACMQQLQAHIAYATSQSSATPQRALISPAASASASDPLVVSLTPTGSVSQGSSGGPPLDVSAFALFLCAHIAEKAQTEEAKTKCFEYAIELLYYIQRKDPSNFASEEEALASMTTSDSEDKWGILEQAYTSAIRTACATEKIEEAKKLLIEMKEASLPLRHKHLAPLFHFYCERDCYPLSLVLDSLKEIVDLVQSQDLQRNIEPEFCAILRRIARSFQTNSVSERNLNGSPPVDEETINTVLGWLSSCVQHAPGTDLYEALVYMFYSAPYFKVCDPYFLGHGRNRCPSCEGQFDPFVIKKEERIELFQRIEKFATGVGDESSKGQFEQFKIFINKNKGKFDCIVDGENVGLYTKTNPKQEPNARLNPILVDLMMQHLVYKGFRPLLILQSKYLSQYGPGESKIQRWHRENMLYPTPTNVNDDWYWLYAALQISNKGGYFVSNDLLRDRIHNMQDLTSFRTWTGMRCVPYHIYVRNRTLKCDTYFPPLYTHKVQYTAKTNAWHVPCKIHDKQNVAQRPKHKTISNPNGHFSWFCAKSKQL